VKKMHQSCENLRFSLTPLKLPKLNHKFKSVFFSFFWWGGGGENFHNLARKERKMQKVQIVYFLGGKDTPKSPHYEGKK